MDKIRDDFNKRRDLIYQLAEQSWKNREQDMDNAIIYNRVAIESRAFVSIFKDHVIHLFPLCGIEAAQREKEMNIVFRNIFTASQHSLLQE